MPAALFLRILSAAAAGLEVLADYFRMRRKTNALPQALEDSEAKATLEKEKIDAARKGKSARENVDDFLAGGE